MAFKDGYKKVYVRVDWEKIEDFMRKSIIVTGPTATGKTQLAVDLCREFDGEYISADSRQVYRGLDIGTGKDLDEFVDADEVTTAYHLMDICDPQEEFSLFHWRETIIDIFANLAKNNKLPILCGGTPLYLDMLLRNYELKGGARQSYTAESLQQLTLSQLIDKLKKFPDLIDNTDLTQRAKVVRALEIANQQEATKRPLPDNDYLVIAPYWHRKIVHGRIEQRLKERWGGMIKETKDLLDRGLTHERLEWFGLEYRYMSRFLLNELSEDEAFDQLLIRIRKFAKRQDIWFRKMERAGTVIHWLPGEEAGDQASQLIKNFLAGEALPKPKIQIKDIVYGPRTQ